MTRARIVALYRLVFAAAALVAVSAQFGVTLRNHFGIVNFFSYFTNLGNLIAIVVFVIGAIRLLRATTDTRAWSIVRFCSAVDMVFVGLVFNILLAGADVGAVLPWVNVIVHMIMPAAVLVDWIIVPPSRRLPWGFAVSGLVFPVVYSVYSLVRGAATDFYPYPFYNPGAIGGYGHVAVYMAALVVGLAVLSVILHWVGRARRGVDSAV